MPRHWYLIRTKPHSEYIAAESLEREGLEFFLPSVRVPQTPSGQVEAPLFPGYLFLRIDADTWPSLLRLPGISGWVRFEGVTPPIPDEVVEHLTERIVTIDGSGGLWTRFRRGQKVRVISGHMDNLAEIVEEPTSPENRVRVLLEFMGRLVAAQVSWHHLRPLQDHKYLTSSSRAVRRTRGKGRWVRDFRPQTASA